MGRPQKKPREIFGQYMVRRIDARLGSIVRDSQARQQAVRTATQPPDSEKVAANLEILKRCGITREAPLPQIPTAPSGTISQVLQITEYGAVVVEGLDDPVSAKTVETWIGRFSKQASGSGVSTRKRK
jgi:hypothetical protein